MRGAEESKANQHHDIGRFSHRCVKGACTTVLTIILVLPTLYRTNEHREQRLRLKATNTMDARYLRDGSREQKIVINL
jgi:hypothetical protein